MTTGSAHRSDMPQPPTRTVPAEPVALRRLTTVTTGCNGRIHLAERLDPRRQRRTLCQLEAVRFASSSAIWARPCHDCIAVALNGGLSVIQEGHALINPQRVPLD